MISGCKHNVRPRRWRRRWIVQETGHQPRWVCLHFTSFVIASVVTAKYGLCWQALCHNTLKCYLFCMITFEFTISVAMWIMLFNSKCVINKLWEPAFNSVKYLRTFKTLKASVWFASGKVMRRWPHMHYHRTSVVQRLLHKIATTRLPQTTLKTGRSDGLYCAAYMHMDL